MQNGIRREREQTMTKHEAEKAILKHLKEIRDIAKENIPGIKILNMAITEEHAWAFAFKDRDNLVYQIDVTSRHGFMEEEDNDDDT
jgi:hypothetical protein